MVDIKIRTGNPGPHIDPTELVLFDEGQLSKESTARIESHLLGCRRCQQELEEIHAGVTAYVSFHQSTYSETSSPPPRGWRDFEERLFRCQIEEDVEGPVLPSSEWKESDSSHSRIFESTNRRLSDSPQAGFKWAFALGLASLTIVVGVFRLISSPGHQVSVAKIIRNASAKQAHDFGAVPDPVVYQKVKIDRRAQGNALAESIVLETWKEVKTSRIRETTDHWSQSEPNSHSVAGADLKGHPPAISPLTISPMMRDIRAIYESNHFDQDSPISLKNFSRWVSSSPQKKETIEELRQDGKVRAYRITAEAMGNTAENAIRSFQIEVRAADWHPIREDLVVVDHSGEQTYEIAELDYRVAPLSEFNRQAGEIFSDVPYGVRPIPKLAQLHPAGQSGREVLIDVLTRLDRVNGLTEDQIRIEREDGIVHIRGTVASEARKTEILAAFNSSANRSNIDIDIRSAMGASHVQSTLNSKSLEAQEVAIPANPEDGNAEVRQYLVATKHLTGSALEQEIQRFTSTALDRSTQVQQHAQALKQIVTAIPERDRQVLGETALESWRSLALRHLQKVRQETANLRNQLSPLLSGSSDNASLSSSISAAGDLDSQVKQLSELANRNDRTLWEVLSASSVGESNPRRLSLSDLRSLDTEMRFAVSIGQTLERSGTHR